ncbi:MAG TPA: PadR family transcriptional regulator [Gaiellaceae bacterium]|nr:PadR family transcriptional regulator [Gaiellaceae bacterium]
MPIHHAVLALLADNSSHGYELKAAFEEAIGPQWGELNIGHLYQVLDRLVRDGLVTRRTVAQSNRPDRIDYRLTDAGRAELERWLQTPFVRSGGYRDDFFLKLLAASRLGKVELDGVLRVQREAYINELAALGEIRQRHAHEPLVALLIEAASLHTAANLRIVDEAEQIADDLVRGARASVARAEAAEEPQSRSSSGRA